MRRDSLTALPETARNSPVCPARTFTFQVPSGAGFAVATVANPAPDARSSIRTGLDGVAVRPSNSTACPMGTAAVGRTPSVSSLTSISPVMLEWIVQW